MLTILQSSAWASAAWCPVQAWSWGSFPASGLGAALDPPDSLNVTESPRKGVPGRKPLTVASAAPEPDEGQGWLNWQLARLKQGLPWNVALSPSVSSPHHSW